MNIKEWHIENNFVCKKNKEEAEEKNTKTGGKNVSDKQKKSFDYRLEMLGWGKERRIRKFTEKETAQIMKNKK